MKIQHKKEKMNLEELRKYIDEEEDWNIRFDKILQYIVEHIKDKEEYKRLVYLLNKPIKKEEKNLKKCPNCKTKLQQMNHGPYICMTCGLIQNYDEEYIRNRKWLNVNFI